jgi:phage-related protein
MKTHRACRFAFASTPVMLHAFIQKTRTTPDEDGAKAPKELER